MTRAQQTISIALLVSSVRRAPIPVPGPEESCGRAHITDLLTPHFLLPALPLPLPGADPPAVRHPDRDRPCGIDTPPPPPFRCPPSLDGIVSLNGALTIRKQLPLWALVSFGAYLLASLGWGVFTFNDCPEAHKELMGEIETAKVELRKLGVTVD